MAGVLQDVSAGAGRARVGRRATKVAVAMNCDSFALLLLTLTSE